jgi:hypothetical protein
MATPQIMGYRPESYPFIGEAKEKHTAPQHWEDEDDEYFRPMSLEEFYARINQSEEDIRAGRVIPHAEVFKKYEQWL